MDIFNTFASAVKTALAPYGHTTVSVDGEAWPTQERSAYIMERDTAIELGGYPKESISLLLACAPGNAALVEDGISLIQDKPGKRAGHVSFGKIVLVETEALDDDHAYEFMQSLKLADIRLQLRDVMLRSSTEQYYINLRVGKRAAAEGFSLEKMGRSIYRCFSELPEVKKTQVVLLTGELPLYKELLPVADSVHKAVLALNTIFDGVEMSCASCNLQSICAEVEGLRELHRAKAKGTQT